MKLSFGKSYDYRAYRDFHRFSVFVIVHRFIPLTKWSYRSELLQPLHFLAHQGKVEYCPTHQCRES